MSVADRLASDLASLRQRRGYAEAALAKADGTREREAGQHLVLLLARAARRIELISGALAGGEEDSK